MLPICSSPSAMRWAPNHTMATLALLMISIMLGNVSANSRVTASVVAVRSALASVKRASSSPVRTNARTTRMPVRFSRSTRFRVSILSCTERKSGTARRSTSPMTTSISGTTTSSRPDSRTFSRSAMITPPTIVIGADTRRSSPTTTNVCTCWTSLVVRVISDGAPKSLTSRSEKRCTRRKSAARTSRPILMAVEAPR